MAPQKQGKSKCVFVRDEVKILDLCKGGMSLVEILWLYRKNKSNIPRQY
jgi:hypothetical protein